VKGIDEGNTAFMDMGRDKIEHANRQLRNELLLGVLMPPAR